jgi:hypothetical protein
MTSTERWCCSRERSPVPHDRSTLGLCGSGRPLVLPENMGFSRRSRFSFHRPFRVPAAPARSPLLVVYTTLLHELQIVPSRHRSQLQVM